MNRHRFARLSVHSIMLLPLLITAPAVADTLSVEFSDPVGDPVGTTIDLTGAVLTWDFCSGHYTVDLMTTTSGAFFGNFRVNLNFQNVDTGTTARDPSFFEDTVNDFDLVTPTQALQLTGMNTRLFGWSPGDRIIPNSQSEFPLPDGTVRFHSAVSLIDDPFARDFLATDTIEAVVLQEAQPCPTIEVNEKCTLADAIHAANNDDDSRGRCPPGGFGADRLVLSADVALTAANTDYHGATGLPVVASYVVIDGAGYMIERDPSAPPFRIFAVVEGGTLNLEDVTVRNGQATPFRGGGIFAAGRASVRLDFVTLTNNTATSGGALYVDYLGNLTVRDSTILGNGAMFTGGGIGSFYSEVIVTNSTLSGNTAHGGGGIDTYYGSVTVTNGTLSGNSADRGGGIRSNYGSVTVTNSTLSGNSADRGAGIENRYGIMTLANSIVANAALGENCGGRAIADAGNNFADDGSCGPGLAAITPGVDLDATLADNGGPTETHALFPTSVARDAAGDCDLETDQRGVSRNDGACDSGAFEIGSATGACCIAPNSQRSCIDDFTEVECETRLGLFAGIGTICNTPITCELLLVTMDSMSASATGAVVEVSWTTAAEVYTAGFRVLRESLRREKTLQLVTNVAAGGNDLDGHTYLAVDDAPAAARARRYYVEDIDTHGRVTRHGPISVERNRREIGRSALNRDRREP